MAALYSYNLAWVGISLFGFLKTYICWLAFLQTELLNVLTKIQFRVQVYTEQFYRFQLFYVNAIYMQVYIIFLSPRAQ